jgi:hypothetical protein
VLVSAADRHVPDAADALESHHYREESLKSSIFVCVLTFAAQAQPILSNLALPKISHATVAITWTVSEDSSPRDSRVYYGTTTALGYSTLIQRNWDSAGSAKYRQLTVSGLQPATTYYFRPESKSSGGASAWSCSPGQSGTGWKCDPGGSGLGMLTTAPLPPDHLGDPKLPNFTMDTSHPQLTGMTFTVSSDCSDLQDKINAAGTADANRNHEVVIPAGTVCTGEYKLPVKSGDNAPGTGWVTIRTSKLSNLPPEGVRIHPKYEPYMAVIQAPLSARGALAYPAAAIAAVAGSHGWRMEGLKIMPETRTPRVLTVQSIDNTGRVTFTTPHGLETHQIIYLAGVNGTYAPAFYGYQTTLTNGMNGAWRVSVVSATTITLQGLSHSTICPAPPCYSGGGYAVISSGVPITQVNGNVITTATKHGQMQFPWTNITSINGRVITVEEVAKTGSRSGPAVEVGNGPQGTTGLWAITAVSGNKLSLNSSFPSTTCSSNCGRVRLKPYLQIDKGRGVAGLNGAHTFEVLDDTHIKLDAAVSGVYKGGGVLAYDPDYWHALVRLPYGASRFVIDRCWITGGGFPNRIYTGVMMNGADAAVINSYIDEINNWITYRKINESFQASPMGNNARYTATAIAIEFTDLQRFKLENNYINAEGINAFAQEGAATNPEDVIIRRNTFWSDPKKMAGGPGAYERYYPKRHNLEFKPVERALVEGNIFDGNWADFVGCGPSISFRSLGDANSYDNTIEDVTFRHNTIRNTSGAIAIIGSDYYMDHYYLFSRRLKISNNLAYGIDKRKWQSNPASASPGVCGYFAAVYHGLEDLEISHNTAYDVRGPQPQFLVWGGARIEGLKLVDNIWVHNHDNGAGALRFDGDPASTSGILPSPQTGSTPYQWFQNWFPNAIFSGNVVIPGVKNTSSQNNYNSSAFSVNYSANDARNYYAGFPDITIVGSGNTAAQRISQMLFRSTPQLDFGLRADSPGVSGRRISGDRLNAGANIEALEAAQGHVSNARIMATDRTAATLAYQAPDVEACSVDYSVAADFSTFTRIGDGGQERERVVPINNLNPGTLYHYRVQCAVEQPEGTFVTAR